MIFIFDLTYNLIQLYASKNRALETFRGTGADLVKVNTDVQQSQGASQPEIIFTAEGINELVKHKTALKSILDRIDEKGSAEFTGEDGQKHLIAKNSDSYRNLKLACQALDEALSMVSRDVQVNWAEIEGTVKKLEDDRKDGPSTLATVATNIGGFAANVAGRSLTQTAFSAAGVHGGDTKAAISDAAGETAEQGARKILGDPTAKITPVENLGKSVVQEVMPDIVEASTGFTKGTPVQSIIRQTTTTITDNAIAGRNLTAGMTSAKIFNPLVQAAEQQGSQLRNGTPAVTRTSDGGTRYAVGGPFHWIKEMYYNEQEQLLHKMPEQLLVI